MKVGGTTIGEMREELFPFTRLDAMRNLAHEIARAANEGQALVERRLRVLPEYASHHEDYGPMFDRIAGLAINLGALLKHSELEEMSDEKCRELSKMALAALPDVIKAMEIRSPARFFVEPGSENKK